MRPVVALFGVLYAAVSCAQALKDTPRDARPHIETRTVLVEVPALVTTAASEVAGVALSAADFRLKDNGVEQVVRLERDDARPLSLVVVMQVGGAAKLMFPQYRGLATMLSAMLGTGPHRAAVVSFDSVVEGATPFAADLSEWTEALNAPDDGDHGAAILDGLAYALGLLRREPPRNRRAILLISQPQDGGSKASAKEILRTAAESDVAIYSVTFSPEKASFKAKLNGSAQLNAPIVVNSSVGPTQAYFNLGEPLWLLLGGLRKNVAAQVAGITGGESLRFDDAKELGADLNRLANHMANTYMLSFTPTSKQAGLHVLEVRLPAHPELSLRARGNYWMADQKGLVDER